VYVFMCVCVYMCRLYECMLIYVSVGIRVGIFWVGCKSICLCACVYVCMCVCLFGYIYMCLRVLAYMCTCMCLYMCGSTLVCMCVYA